MEFDAGSMLGSSVGGAIVVFLAQFYFQRAFKTLDATVSSLETIKVELATVAVKLGNTEKDSAILDIHGIQIAKLEERLDGVIRSEH